MTKRILAIVPAYNEEESIVSTVEDLKANAPEADFIVINDGSKDRTADICRENGYPLISLPVNLGLAGGFQTGMKYALAHGYDYAVQFDADGQHSAAYIKAMVDEAKRSGSNIVIGSRFVEHKKPMSARMIGARLLTVIIHITTGHRISDPTSGMRLFDAETIPIMAYELDFGPEPDTMALLSRMGFSISEVQVEMRERVAGESYLTITKSAGYMARMCLSILFIQWFRGKRK